MFFPLAEGGLKPKLEYVRVDATAASTLDGSTPDIDKPVEGEEPPTGKVAAMTLVVTRPDSKKETDKMKKLLEKEKKEWDKILENTEASAKYAAMISGAKCMTDVYAQLLAQIDSKSGECIGVLKDPEVASALPSFSAAGNIQANSCDVDGLMAGELFDSWDAGQKHRFSKVAVGITAIMTVYGLYQALVNKDK
jgi:hypothetical protein